MKLQFQAIKFRPQITILNCDLTEFLASFCIGLGQLVGVEHSSRPWDKRKRIGQLTRKILKLRQIKWAAVSDVLSIWPFNDNPLIKVKELFGKEIIMLLVVIF